MVSSSEKNIVLFSGIFGSVFIFSTSLASLNAVLICKKNEYNNKTRERNLNKIIIVNGIAMIFSGLAFSYFTYIGSK